MSKIPWTEKTWNPVVGCTKVSAGCLNCYAERMAVRLAGMGQEKYQAVTENTYYGNPKIASWSGKIVCDEKALEIPLHWKNPCTIFVNSMGDTFHEQVPFEFIDKMAAIIEKCPQHVFQILTKRPEVALKYSEYKYKRLEKFNPRIRPNIHFGWTAENQEMADLRTPIGLQVPAAIRFVSAEPLLGDIDFSLPFDYQAYTCSSKEECICGHKEYHKTIGRIDQVIIGAESNGSHPGRECKIEWVRNIVRQCKVAGVAVFVKQIHMWRTKLPESLFKSAPIVPVYFETEAEALEWEGTKPKRVLLKYPRDKDLFPTDLQCWEYPESEVKK